MKLSEYAKLHGVCYRTAWNRFHAGKIPNSFQNEFGNITVKTNNLKVYDDCVAVYSRVSSSQNKDNLESQAKRLTEYATAKGYIIKYVVKEIGSGVNDNRKKLLKLFSEDDWGILIVEHKDRLTRFGFNYIEVLLEQSGRKIEVVNQAEDDKSDLMQDFVSIVTSFCARIYGLRRTKRQTEKIISELITNDKSEEQKL